MSESFQLSHIPVLLNEAISMLCLTKTKHFLDCTFGGGGHASALLSASNNNVIYAIDRDPEASKRAKVLAKEFQKKFFFFNINFSNIENLYMPPLDGILMDLGLSSFQLDDKTRGFSFRYNANLDMRMDNSNGLTASEFLNIATEEQLIEAIRDFGEEHNWKKIVHAILNNRGTHNLLYSDLFAELIQKTIKISNKKRIHPATKTFQGIRIAINDELKAIEYALPVLFSKLKIGGRLVIISFHSLEDRIIKQFFKKMSGQAVNNLDFEPTQYKEKLAKILTTKPIIPSDQEIAANPRSRSAKMRVLERIK